MCGLALWHCLFGLLVLYVPSCLLPAVFAVCSKVYTSVAAQHCMVRLLISAMSFCIGHVPDPLTAIRVVTWVVVGLVCLEPRTHLVCHTRWYVVACVGMAMNIICVLLVSLCFGERHVSMCTSFIICQSAQRLPAPGWCVVGTLPDGLCWVILWSKAICAR